MATGNERFAELLKNQDYEMITSFKQTYIDALKHYYFVGGMPEAVQSFAESKDFNEVRAIQKRTCGIRTRLLKTRTERDCPENPYALEQYSVAARKRK